jgi:hypothetical protein
MTNYRVFSILPTIVICCRATKFVVDTDLIDSILRSILAYYPWEVMMKSKQFWCYALALAAGLLVSSSVYGLTFTDSFNNLDNWTVYGSPSPVRLASAEDKTGVFDNMGDATDKSGGISIQTFGLTGGFTIQSDVYLDFSDTNGCYAEAAIGIANPTVQGWGGYDPYIYFSIGGMGHSCGTIAEALRGHAYFFGSFATGSGDETFYPTESSPLADEYANGWHTLKIVVNSSFQIRFYIDAVLIYTGTQSINSTIATGAYPLWLGSQSSGNAGKAYHDFITITTSCDPPSAPSLSTPGVNAVVCATSVSFVWNDVVGATNYQMQVDNNSDFASPETDLGFTPPTHSVSIALTDNCLPQYWRVRAKNACNWGDWSTTRNVTVCSAPTAPTLAAPANDAVDLAQPIALNWNDIGGASYYQIQVDTDSGFVASVVDHNRTVSADTLSELAGSTMYFWRVRAASGCAASTWSSIYNFTTAVCNMPDTATLIAPAYADSGQTQPLTLNWSDVATALSYRVQVDNDSAFESVAFDNEVTLSTLDLTGLTAGTIYFWRVRSYNGCGWGDWSDTSWFKTCYMVGAPVLVTPTDGDTIMSMPASFDWDNVTTATKYQFQIDDTITCVSPLADVQLVASQYGTYDLSFGVRYYWRVRAYGTCGWGTWSSARSCTTSAALAVEEIGTGSMPTAYSLAQNYPNPFNPSTAIEFTLPRPCQVTLEVYDIVGRKVRTLVSEAVTAGAKRVIWDGCDAGGATAASGVYFYRIKAGDFIETRKMLLLK